MRLVRLRTPRLQLALAHELEVGAAEAGAVDRVELQIALQTACRAAAKRVIDPHIDMEEEVAER